MKNSQDNIKERRMEVLKLIEARNYISVEELVNRFKVSPVTMRRDLDYWENLGAVKRSHGGVTPISSYSEDLEYQPNRFMMAIAKKAASFVEDGDVIFVNSSKTALMMLDYFENKHVTVVTNNARAIVFRHDENVNLILTGGMVPLHRQCMYGGFAESTLNSICASKCFIGVSGICEHGASNATIDEIFSNKIMLERTKGLRCIVCDYRKVGLHLDYCSSNLDNIDLLITDENADEKTLKKIKKAHPNLKIIQVNYIKDLQNKLI